MKLGNTFNKLGSSCFNSFQGKLNFDCKSEHISNTGANTFTNITLENSPESNISFDLKSDNKNYTIGLNCFKNIKDIPININFNDNSDNDTILNLEANCFENFTGILNLNWYGSNLQSEDTWNTNANFKDESKMCILYDRYNGNEIRGPPIKCTIVNYLKYSDEDNLDLSLIKYQTEFKELNIHYTFRRTFEITEEKNNIK